jgi:hypothetical protein
MKQEYTKPSIAIIKLPDITCLLPISYDLYGDSNPFSDFGDPGFEDL